MSNKNKEIVRKENAVQAIVIADTFGDEFLPISDTIPLALLPVLNKPLVDYTLEFLSLGGIEETFLFCCTHVEAIKEHIDKCVRNGDSWTITMKVNIIVSESCHSFGDCLRDLDAKGLLRGDFVLIEPGTISNVQLLPLLKKHSETVKHDKYAAMTLVLQESGIGYIGRCPDEEMCIATNSQNRLLFHKNLGKTKEKKITFPTDIFLENSVVSLNHNFKDTHIAICSPSVLPLFSDNFDFQTKGDLIRNLLMNEEILEGTVYVNVLKGSQSAGTVSSWRMYQALSQELKNNWMFPLCSPKSNRTMKDDVVVGRETTIYGTADLQQTVIADNVKIGPNVKIEDSFVFSNAKIEGNVTITHSLIGPGCTIKSGSKVTAGCVLGEGTVIEKNTFVENTLVQATKPGDFEEGDELGPKAYRIRVGGDEDEDVDVNSLARRFSHINLDESKDTDSEEESGGFSDSDSEELSYTQSPAPDDTKLFFTEVIDSLTRGFEDNLLCDNLILEINSSRYAYNVTVKEVNFNVVKAILTMSLRQPTGVQYYSHLSRLLSYFAPVLKNYIRNESAMTDSLQAIEDIATSNEELKEKWVMFVMQHLYDKDYVTEDAILVWFEALDKKSKFHAQVKPFTDWLQEAEEASSDEEDGSD